MIRLMLGKRVISVISAICFSLGLWQLGHAGYIEAKAWLAQYLLQQAWEETLAGESQVKPWPWADLWPVARMQVKRLGVDRIVLSDASGRTMAFGPGHIAGTEEIGQEGNSAISGHRDTHFRFLRKLTNGDRIDLILRDGTRHSYMVARSSVHDKHDTWMLEDTGDEQLTLVTCYPFDALVPGGPLRYVVQARAVVF